MKRLINFLEIILNNYYLFLGLLDVEKFQLLKFLLKNIIMKFCLGKIFFLSIFHKLNKKTSIFTRMQIIFLKSEFNIHFHNNES